VTLEVNRRQFDLWQQKLHIVITRFKYYVVVADVIEVTLSEHEDEFSGAVTFETPQHFQHGFSVIRVSARVYHQDEVTIAK